MNKYLLFALLISLSAIAQDYKAPEVEMASETVAVPDIIEPLAENPIDTTPVTPFTEENAAATAPVEENVPDAPAEATADTPDFEETTTPSTSIPAVTDTTEEVKDPGPSPIAGATPALSTEITNDDDFNFYKGHWQTIFAFEASQYETGFNFDKTTYSRNNQRGTKKLFRPGDQDLYGGRLGFGREFYIGGGLSTTSRAEGFYNGTVAAKRKSAERDVDDIDISYSKVTGQVFGFDISQSLGYIFEAKTKNPFMDEITHFTIEPFVEAGMGVAQALMTGRYKQDTGTGTTGIREEYRMRTADNLASARVSAGFNITGRSGFFMFSRVTQTRYEVLERNNSGYYVRDPESGAGRGTKVSLKDSDVKGAKVDPITVFTIGGGYKF